MVVMATRPGLAQGCPALVRQVAALVKRVVWQILSGWCGRRNWCSGGLLCVLELSLSCGPE